MGRQVVLLCLLLVPISVQAAPARTRQAPIDPKLVDEMAADLARYAEEVSGFRKAAGNIIRRTYIERIKAIREKYEPMITANEKQEKQRRIDAIAVLEGFLRKYPSDKKWTPDVMFRLAELFYEKSSDEFLTAQEDFQKALDSPNPPSGQPPKADYTQTIGLYRRLLVEFPNYRLLDATRPLLVYKRPLKAKFLISLKSVLAFIEATNDPDFWDDKLQQEQLVKSVLKTTQALRSGEESSVGTCV